jgi:hypothetical protein
MKRKHVGIVLSFCVVALMCLSTIYCDDSVLTEQEILSVLPKESMIALIPEYGIAPENKIEKKKNAIIKAKLFPNFPEQIVVGYVTKTGKEDDTLCNVAIISKKNNKIIQMWTSEEFGFNFGMEIPEKGLNREQKELVFAVKDLNNDGTAELVFSRISFGAEGSLFEIWGYDKRDEKMKQIFSDSGAVELIYTEGKAWPIIKTTSFHSSTLSCNIFKYDNQSAKYKLIQIHP